MDDFISEITAQCFRVIFCPRLVWKQFIHLYDRNIFNKTFIYSFFLSECTQYNFRAGNLRFRIINSIHNNFSSNAKEKLYCKALNAEKACSLELHFFVRLPCPRTELRKLSSMLSYVLLLATEESRNFMFEVVICVPCFASDSSFIYFLEANCQAGISFCAAEVG